MQSRRCTCKISTTQIDKGCQDKRMEESKEDGRKQKERAAVCKTRLTCRRYDCACGRMGKRTTSSRAAH
eukprot:190725-Chlamydomonas_euryale.AAC.1